MTEQNPMGGRIHEAQGNLVATASFSVTTASRHYIASQHLWAARHQARLCSEAEAGTDAAPFDIRHRTFAIGAVLSSVSFLEALVNEVFQDAADSTGHVSMRIEPIGTQSIALMAEFWNASEGADKYVSMLNKFQLALLFAEKDKFSQGANPFQDAKLLVAIRNELVHFRPETQAQDVVGKLEQRVRGKFPENSLMAGMGNPWFPDKCLGAGCAEWSWRTSVQLANEWTSRLGILRVYEADLAHWPEP